MKKCALCGIKDADKKNTHYLSDNVIRKALNTNGSNGRGYGSFCEISTMSPFVKYRFQQNVAHEVIVENLRRDPQESEIEYEKHNIAYSVDYVFCSDCEEKVFGKIENDFNKNVLLKLRNGSLSPGSLSFKDVKTIRLYFFLQIWRSHVCNPDFNIDEQLASILKRLISQDKCSREELTSVPLSVSYMITPDDFEHTRNSVGYLTQKNPYVIFMDEFVIQLYDNRNAIRFDPLFGINECSIYTDYINYQENSFAIQIIDSDRRIFINRNIVNYMAKQAKKKWTDMFIEFYVEKNGFYPTGNIIDLFDAKLSSRSVFWMNKYSWKEIQAIINECSNVIY